MSVRTVKYLTPVTITFTFRDEDGVLKNPATIDAHLLAPSGAHFAFTKAQLRADGTGIFKLDTELDEVGTWAHRADSPDAIADADAEGILYAERSFLEAYLV